MFQKIKSYLFKSNHAQWCIFALFALTIFLQCCLFHWLAFQSILISSLWKNPLAFWAFYLPKISISLFIASFVFLFKRKGWTIITSLFINVWIITELIYSRANSIFLDAYSMTLIENMVGFWDSILAFVYIQDIVLVIPTIILIFAFSIFINHGCHWRNFVVCICSSLILNGIGLNTLYNYNLKWRTMEDGMIDQSYKYTLNPFGKNIRNIVGEGWVQDGTITKYITHLSVIHHFILNVVDMIKLEDNNFELPTKDEDRLVNDFIYLGLQDSITPSNPLILCLIESFETWAISLETTPNLYKEISTNQNLLYCPHIISQRRAGNSADGQMIVNTGLLPLQEGAAVFRFPFNKYPSLSSLYESSIGIFPHELGAWNQRYMNQSYEIDSGIVVSSSDKIIFPKIIELSQSNDYILALTMSTHAPFNTYADSSKLYLSDELPETLRKYLKCINVMDEGLGILLDAWHSNEKIHNSTIVITSDHNIFKEGELNWFHGSNENLNKSITGFCPLVIISPKLDNNIYISDTLYQMDIYPTILHLIGCEDYYWKGFGVNILDSVARNNRPISEQEAFVLSDKIIRANWFESFVK